MQRVSEPSPPSAIGGTSRPLTNLSSPPPRPHAAPWDGASDEVLAGRAADGDVGSFEALVERYGALVVAALERLVGDHHLALDAAQEVWIKVYRNLDRYQRGAKLRPWLFAIALNHGRDVLRGRARRPDTSAGSDAFDAAPTEAALVAPRASDPSLRLLERGAIGAALATLEPRFREALVLVDVMGLGYEEAALALDANLGTVKSRVHRARLAFRDEWLRLEKANDTDRANRPQDGRAAAAPRRPRPQRSQS